MKDKKINGLKGICCLMVAIGHAFALLMPQYYFGESVDGQTVLGKALHASPLNFFFNGGSALWCFFVLSGYLIPLRRFLKGEDKRSLKKMWGGRYLRMMPMALIGSILGWLVMKLGMVYSIKLLDVSKSYSYAGIYNNFVPAGMISKDGPIIDGCIKVFLGWSKYNPVMGTIGVIWLFSLPLLVITKYFYDKNVRWIFYILLIAIALLGKSYRVEIIYLVPMTIGMILSDLINNCQFFGKVSINFKKILFVIGIYCITVPLVSYDVGIYDWIQKIGIINNCFLYLIGWTTVVWVLETEHWFDKFFDTKWIQDLGDISFAVYVVHWPIEISFTSYIAYLLYYSFSLNYEIVSWLAIIISVPVIVIVANLVKRYLYRWIYEFIIKRRI